MAVGDVDVRLTQMRAFNSNRFDGVDDYVEIPHSDRQLGANLSEGFTVSAWLYVISGGEVDAGRVLVKSESGTTSTNGFSFFVKADSGTYIQFSLNGGTVITTSVGAFSLNNWFHALITITPAGVGNIYKNGVNIKADIASGQNVSTISAVNNMVIGNNYGSTDRTFKGCIKDVKMWNRILTTDEIALDYAGLSVCPNNLIHYFKLGGDYHDYGLVGVDATNSGSVPRIQEDTLAQSISGSWLASNMNSGAYMIAKGQNGQIINVGIYNKE